MADAKRQKKLKKLIKKCPALQDGPKLDEAVVYESQKRRYEAFFVKYGENRLIDYFRVRILNKANKVEVKKQGNLKVEKKLNKIKKQKAGEKKCNRDSADSLQRKKFVIDRNEKVAQEMFVKHNGEFVEEKEIDLDEEELIDENNSATRNDESLKEDEEVKSLEKDKNFSENHDNYESDDDHDISDYLHDKCVYSESSYDDNSEDEKDCEFYFRNARLCDSDSSSSYSSATDTSDCDSSETPYSQNAPAKIDSWDDDSSESSDSCEDKYFLQQNWGTFRSTYNWKATFELPFDFCIKNYQLNTSLKIQHERFDCIEKARNIKCKLPALTQDLLKRIFDLNSFDKLMRDYKFDLNTMNSYRVILGSRVIPSAGYFTVDKRMKHAQLKKFFMDENSGKYQYIRRKIIENRYRGLQIEFKHNIECAVAHRITNKSTHILEIFYEQLKTKIEVVDKNSETFKLILDYMNNSASYQYDDFTMEIDEIFAVKCNENEECYYSNLDNKTLLWHGTRDENIASVLRDGFEIRSSSGSVMKHRPLGNGCYFFNTAHLAVHFNRSSDDQKQGILLLCEVALGNMKKCYNPKPKVQDLSGFTSIHSLFGTGILSPDEKDTRIIFGEVKVPCGPLITPELDHKTVFQFDQFVVYNPCQIKVRFCVVVNFNYKKSL